MHEAKSNLSRLVDRALAGDDVVITRHGEPVGRLVAITPDPPSMASLRGTWQGRVKVADDMEALPPDISDALGAR